MSQVRQYRNINRFDVDVENESCYEGCTNCCGCMGGWLRTYIPCVSWICCACTCKAYQEVDQSHWGVIQKFGKHKKIVDAGLHHVNPLSEKMITVSKKQKVLDLNRQTCMTKDNITLDVDSNIFYHVNDPYTITYRVDSSLKQLISELVYAQLRLIVGQYNLQDILVNKDIIGPNVKEVLDKYANEWGIVIEMVNIKDLKMSKAMSEALSAKTTAEKYAESKMISARADVESAKMMREAADILNSETAIQFRMLDTYKHIASSPNTKIVFLPPLNDSSLTKTMIAMENSGV